MILVDCIEAAIYIAPDADNPGCFWGVVDDDFCPWHEVYADDDYGDSVRARPWRMIQDVNLGGRPRKQARVPQSDTDSDSRSEEHEDATSSSEDSDGDEDSGAQHLHDVDLNLDISLGVGAVLFGN